MHTYVDQGLGRYQRRNIQCIRGRQWSCLDSDNHLVWQAARRSPSLRTALLLADAGMLHAWAGELAAAVCAVCSITMNLQPHINFRRQVHSIRNALHHHILTTAPMHAHDMHDAGRSAGIVGRDFCACIDQGACMILSDCCTRANFAKHEFKRYAIRRDVAVVEFAPAYVRLGLATTRGQLACWPHNQRPNNPQMGFGSPLRCDDWPSMGNLGHDRWLIVSNGPCI